MRVIATVGAMTDDDHEFGETLDQTDAAQKTGDAINLFKLGKPLAWRFGAGRAGGLRRLGSRRQNTVQRPLEGRAPTRVQGPQTGRHQGASEQAEQGQRRREASHQGGLQKTATTALVQALLPGLTPAAALTVPGERRLTARRRLFVHGILRAHDDGTKRTRHSVVQSLPAHRHAEKTGSAKGLNGRIDLFEMPPRAFFPIIHAEHQLRYGQRYRRARAIVVGAQGGENPFAVVPFVG